MKKIKSIIEGNGYFNLAGAIAGIILILACFAGLIFFGAIYLKSIF